MNKQIMIKLMALVFACCFNSAQAATLTVGLPGNSLNYPTTVGSTFDVNIFVDALSNFALFDFNLTYDSTKLTALTLASGSIFGAANTQAIPSSITTNLGVGTIHFAETIDGTSPLTAGIDVIAPTLLETVHFQARATGANSLLNITNVILNDWNGNPYAGNTLQTAYVSISPAAAVPLPSTALLFAPGLLAVFGFRKGSIKPGKLEA